MGVFVIGAGFCGSFPSSGGLSYRELIARAAVMAYADAGITADQLDGAVSVEEDFISGYSISDEYTPDQLGVVRKPVYTICGDFLHGVCSAAMQINTGRYNLVVVEGYSKASNCLSKDETLHFAYDPVWNRLDVSPHYLAGIEMKTFLSGSDFNIGDVSELVARHRANAVGNSQAPYGAGLAAGDVLGSRPVAEPVTELMIARPSDAAVVMVLASDSAVKAAKNALRLSGLGWASGNSIIERRSHGVSEGSKLAAAMAYREAGITNPSKECDVFYVSDLYAHRALMHVQALGLGKADLARVNPDGGALGMGDMFEATGGARLYDAVKTLRSRGASRAVVHGWRGLPTDSCAVAVLEGGKI